MKMKSVKDMKIFLRILVTTASVVVASTTYGQVFYSSPEPKGSEPMVMKVSDALAEAASVSSSCGYTRAYISSADIQNLMSLKDAVGIRIYNAKETSGQRYCDIVAVAVNNAGKEIGPQIGNKYLHAESHDASNSCTSKRISKSKAQGCVNTVATSDLIDQKVFFSRSMLSDRIKVQNATGISILPGQLPEGSTMMVAAAKLENGKLTELEDNYLKSRLPCPTDCGDSGNYLVAPK